MYIKHSQCISIACILCSNTRMENHCKRGQVVPKPLWTIHSHDQLQNYCEVGVNFCQLFCVFGYHLRRGAGYLIWTEKSSQESGQITILRGAIRLRKERAWDALHWTQHLIQNCDKQTLTNVLLAWIKMSVRSWEPCRVCESGSGFDEYWAIITTDQNM